jgi:hypothetical protein
VLAGALQAVAVLGLHLLPDLWARLEVELLARAVAGAQGPVHDLAELAVLLGVLEQALLALGLVHAAQAEVVVAADRGDRGPLERQHRVQERQVLLLELLLERDGARGDHDRPFALAAVGVHRRGQQVGERLAGAGPGLGDEVSALGERALDGEAQLELLVADLEVRQPPRDRALGPEQPAHVQGGVAHVSGCPPGRRRRPAA